MTPDEQTALRERWRSAGVEVARHDEAQQTRLRDAVGAAEAAVLEVIEASQDSLSPTRVLELLARRRNGVTQSAAALAIQRLVDRGYLRLTPAAELERSSAA